MPEQHISERRKLPQDHEVYVRLDVIDRQLEAGRTCMDNLTNTTAENTRAINRIGESIEGLVGAWDSTTGALRVAKFVSKFMAVLAVIGAAWHQFIKNLPGGWWSGGG